MTNNDNANTQKNDHITNTFLGLDLDIQNNIISLIKLVGPVVGVVGGLRLYNAWSRKPDVTFKTALAKLDKAKFADLMDYLKKDYEKCLYDVEVKDINLIKIVHQLHKSAEINSVTPLTPQISDMIAMLSGSSDVPGFVIQNPVLAATLAKSDSLMSNSYDVLAGQNLAKGVLNVAEMYDPQTYQAVIE